EEICRGVLFLCLKHLFVMAAPVYFVYLLRHYCRGGFFRGFGWFLMMGVAVGMVFVLAFAPFLYYKQIEQVIHCLFPFGRGLCHAYWAPNFWVFYIIIAKGFAFMLRKLGLNIKAPVASFTGGLVGDSSPFAVLPQVTPLITFISVLVALSPCLIKAWKEPHRELITRWVAYAYTCGFVFGWHVHEKASLHFMVPLAVVAVQSLEYPIKVLLLVLHSLLMWSGFTAQYSKVAASNTSRSTDIADTKIATSEFFSKTAKEGGAAVVGVFEMCYLVGVAGESGERSAKIPVSTSDGKNQQELIQWHTRFSVQELSVRGTYYTARVAHLDMTKTVGRTKVLLETVPVHRLADIFVASSEISFEEQLSMLDSVDLKVRLLKATELVDRH
ncbi:hypothetical protein IFM89_018649, partial [Coptis chinensis]